ncbi:MAG: hypothetical protein AMJ55_00320 [Gammaproteobacteria bacterium SG8_15]|nr:MAG: hypothetical protein AMJ55_00320 [Gammaproteobacteria bacterium SG8_15]
MGYKVYGSKVAIVRDEAEETTAGGIVIPETARAKLPVGTVIAIGEMFEEDGWDYGIVEGERVLFSKYGGTSFDVKMPDGSKLLVELVHAKDVYVGWKGEEQ